MIKVWGFAGVEDAGDIVLREGDEMNCAMASVYERTLA
jgi:hypothetical protein